MSTPPHDAPPREGRRSLYLIRHGQSVWNAAGRWQGAADPPLSDRGREQAAQIAAVFAKVSLDAIISSPQERARETAAPLASAKEIDVEIDADIAEIDVGSWSGLSRAEIEERAPGSLDGYRTGLAPWIGGERYEDHEARVARAIRRLEQRTESQIAVVSHGGTIRALARELLGIPHALRHRFGGVSNGEIVELELREPDGQWMLMAWGTRCPRSSS